MQGRKGDIYRALFRKAPTITFNKTNEQHLKEHSRGGTCVFSDPTTYWHLVCLYYLHWSLTHNLMKDMRKSPGLAHWSESLIPLSKKN